MEQYVHLQLLEEHPTWLHCLKLSLSSLLQINRESWCTIEPCADAASLLAPPQSPGKQGFPSDSLEHRCPKCTCSRATVPLQHRVVRFGDLFFLSMLHNDIIPFLNPVKL